MVHLDATLAKSEEPGDKGLKEGALGFISSVVVGVASTAPAYSLAATLGFVVIAIDGLQAPIITILAFVPMLLHLLRVQGPQHLPTPTAAPPSPGPPAPSGPRRGGWAGGASSPPTSW